MSWERDPLWAKARLFFQRAFDAPRDDPQFGIWCALGLEILGRAAIASVSPTLLAEPDPSHRNLLHALNRGSEKAPPKSIGAVRVFDLCKSLFKEVSEEDVRVANALINRRNDELHSGNSAFVEYPSKIWLGGFYGVCQSLSVSLGESLETLFGKEESEIAAQILEESKIEVRQRIQSLIAAQRKVFEGKTEAERI